MTRLFSRLRHKPAFIIIALITAFILVQAAASFALLRNRQKIINRISQTIGCRVNTESISFDFLRGLHLKKVSVFYANQDNPALLIKNIFISPGILPLLLRRTLVVQAAIDKAQVLLKKEKDGLNLQVIFSDAIKRMPEFKFPALPIFKNEIRLRIREAEIAYTHNENIKLLLKDARLRQGEERLNFDSTVQFKYRFPQDAYVSKLFSGNELKQEMNCSLQGTLKEKDLIIELISLTAGKDQILGTGVTRGYAEKNPYIDINFMQSVISLESLSFLKDRLDVDGHTFFFARLYGAMDDAKIILSGKLQDCSLSSLPGREQLYEIKGLDAALNYKDNEFRLENSSLKINSLPLNIRMLSVFLDKPDIILDISLTQEFIASSGLPLQRLEVVLKGKAKRVLEGNAELNLSYLKAGANVDMRGYFKGISLDYRKPFLKDFSCAKIELIRKEGGKIQKLSFSDFKSGIHTDKNRSEVKQLAMNGYGATLAGEMALGAQKSPFLGFTLKGEGLEAESLFHDINITDKILTGDTKVKITFDNKSPEFLKGAFFIKKGRANLDILAKIIGSASLKSTNFDTMDIHFLFTKEKITITDLRMHSSDVQLEASWDTNGSIEGKLNLKLSSQLLNQSPPFKKLLSMTRIKSPFIDFDFTLGGTPEVVRVEWLKGEFRDKIKKALPARIEKSIENNLDKMIDELSAKENL